MNKNLLTSRENDILNLIFTGKTNRKIGGRNRIDIILWFINKRVTKIQ